jgi:hypothetical protein
MLRQRLLNRIEKISLIVIAVLLSTSAVLEGQDLDNNGFRDAYEQEIANKFVPCLFLNTTEYANCGVNTRPSPVEIMTDFMAEGFKYEIDGSRIRLGEASFNNLLNTNYSWINNINGASGPAGSNTQWSCIDGIPVGINYHFEYAGTSNGCDPYGGTGDTPYGWYLHYKTIDQNGARYPLTVYCHQFKATQSGQFHDKLIVQYWFFYPFNSFTNNHEGDWEHIDVVVSSDDPATSAIEGVWYYFHEFSRYQPVGQAPGRTDFDYYVEDGTHPVVFVGGWGDKDITLFGVEYHGDGYASHGCYPIWGNWEEIYTYWDYKFNDAVSCTHGAGTLNYQYAQLPGHPNWIYWTDFVRETTPNGRYGVVLLKEPDQYDYSYNPFKPNMSWLKANVYWGHIRVNSLIASLVSPWGYVGNWAPVGPAYHSGWDFVGNNSDEGINYYSLGLPRDYWAHVSDASWTAPPPPCYDTDTPIANVVIPDNGDYYVTGQTIPISWWVNDAELEGIRCYVYMTTNPSNPTWSLLSSNIALDADGSGHYNYQVPYGAPGNVQVQIKVRAVDACGGREGSDVSDGWFTVQYTPCPPKDGDPIPMQPDPVSGRIATPEESFLSAPFPNPFNPNTTIRFGLKEPASVSLMIYDVTGAVVKSICRNESFAAGSYSESWDGKNDGGISVSSGIYFLKLNAGDYAKTQRMILLR